MTEEIIKEEFDKVFKKNFPEAVIIDGVDVAGCVRLQDDKISCDLGGECKGWENCYYKQLKRLEQENKKLKEEIKSQQMINLKQQEIALDYWNALEEIKNNFMCFRSCMIPFHIGNKENLPHNMADTIQNYCESIINKINEVLQ